MSDPTGEARSWYEWGRFMPRAPKPNGNPVMHLTVEQGDRVIAHLTVEQSDRVIALIHAGWKPLDALIAVESEAR